jgi:hypothetical protein
MTWEEAVKQYIDNRDSCSAEKAGAAIKEAGIYVGIAFSALFEASNASPTDLAGRIKDCDSFQENTATVRNVLNHFGYENETIRKHTNHIFTAMLNSFGEVRDELKELWVLAAEREAGI